MKDGAFDALGVIAGGRCLVIPLWLRTSVARRSKVFRLEQTLELTTC
jgi:hypothetical protein